MKISSVEFVTSAVGPGQYPSIGEPEIALVGRSNVGKSSLINKFVNRRNLARTSSQPGKTQTLNFYHINQSWYMVDLPGYGYAKVAKTIQSQWQKFIEDYLLKRKELRGVIQVVDIRHPPSNDDQLMYDWIKYHRLPCLIVATKTDKISRGQWMKQARQIESCLEIDPEHPLLLFSAETGQGVEELGSWLEERLNLNQ